LKNLWTQDESSKYTTDLELRVYTSQLLGRNDELVLHGGGNTSVKSVVDGEDILYVKGSGWDLVSIEKEGFAPVKLDTLIAMAKLDNLSDTDMVSGQKEAMIDSKAPNPSVEAILHAIIPFKFVDHTHSDAVVTISNNENGLENIQKVYPNYLIIPYVMPGFILAQTIYNMSKDLDWENCDGIILHNHGIFTFDNNAKKSYDKMIAAVTLAETFIEENASVIIEKYVPRATLDIEQLQSIIKTEKQCDIVIKVNQSPLALHYASQRNIQTTVCRGVLTPEHIIRTKRVPLVLENNNIQGAIDKYKEDYESYFEEFNNDKIMLNPSPNWAVIKNFGTVSFGKNDKEAKIIEDINNHTMMAVLRADILGGFKSISLKDSFEMEYWELEQAKLKK